MPTITQPANGASVGCTVQVKGNCEGGTVTVTASSGGDGAGREEGPCNGGSYDITLNLCGVNKNDQVVITASGSGSPASVTVTLNQNCGPC